MAKISYFLLIGVIMWHGIYADDDPVTEAGHILKKFTPTLFKVIASKERGDLVYSPISLWMIMALTSAGARGETERKMRAILNLPVDKNNDIARSNALLESLKIYNTVELRMANKIFLDERFLPKEDFSNVARNGFQSEIQNVNFKKPIEACQTINDWCKYETHNTIPDLISPDVLTSDTKMVLTNAIYFKGKWAIPFNPNDTESLNFNINKETKVPIPTMVIRNQNYVYNNLKNVNARAIAIPYKSNDNTKRDEINMIIILPDKVDGLAEIEKNIDKISLDDIFLSWPRKVILSLPKFKITSNLNLEEPLKQMGLDIFYGSADFSGISDENLEVSSVIQKAFIEVNEEGTEAAAATEVGLGFRFGDGDDGELFTVDRPFLLAITLRTMGNTQHVPIFMARYTGQSEVQKTNLHSADESSPINKSQSSSPKIPVTEVSMSGRLINKFISLKRWFKKKLGLSETSQSS